MFNDSKALSKRGRKIGSFINSVTPLNSRELEVFQFGNQGCERRLEIWPSELGTSLLYAFGSYSVTRISDIIHTLKCFNILQKSCCIRYFSRSDPPSFFKWTPRTSFWFLLLRSPTCLLVRTRRNLLWRKTWVKSLHCKFYKSKQETVLPSETAFVLE